MAAAQCLCLFFTPTSVTAQITSVVEGTIADERGLPLSGAQVTLSNSAQPIRRTVVTDASGHYRIPALPAGDYRMTVRHSGFTPRDVGLELTLNRTMVLDLVLEVGQMQETVTVRVEGLWPEREEAVHGKLIAPVEIKQMPLNGRDYLDLLQLVPGVAINRAADSGSDTAVPVLGERAGNTGFMLNGFNNQDVFNGGAAARFNLEMIAEFQVLTTGYKAEFGYASGGIVNAISKSGANDWHGGLSIFHRHDALDASNVPDAAAPALRRWDYSLTGGGPFIKDRVFFFGSGERITERRQLNFIFPALTPQVLRDFESRYDQPGTDTETRTFFRLDEQIGQHQLTQQASWATGYLTDFLPLSKATNLPSTRRNMSLRHLTLGIGDTVLFGPQSAPFVLTFRGQYSDEQEAASPAHPDAGPETAFEMFSDHATGSFFGDLGQVVFGSALTPLTLRQRSLSVAASVAAHRARHTLKGGWNFTRTRADGTEANLLYNQLFSTLQDFASYGPINSGLFTLRTRGGSSLEDNLIRLRNNYHGAYIQDDLTIRRGLNLNLGLRWDYDSAFPNAGNFSPRLGFAWSVSRRVVVRGSWGLYYDHLRTGLVRDIPAFGGANISNLQPVSYPRLFYGVPTIAPIVFGLCLSPTLTDAQISASGATCQLGPVPLIGVDRLNQVVAPGHAPVPANTVLSISNVQALTGFSPQQFAEAASLSIGRAPGFFFWGPFGTLTHTGSPAAAFPVTLDKGFRTPHTSSLSLGLQSELGRHLLLDLSFYHKKIRNIVGMRLTNLPFEARLPEGPESRASAIGFQQPERGFGAWFKGTYTALSVTLGGRFNPRVSFEANYTYARAMDNARCANLVTGLVLCAPSDSFTGIPPVVTDSLTGQSNASGPFIAGNGNPVPQAGIFYNGADYDWGPSDLALRHTFLAHTIIEAPWGLMLSTIFRAQSGFPFSRKAEVPVDIDGDLNFNDLDHTAGRNAFNAPANINVDFRLSKSFRLSERIRLVSLIEFFNLFNRRNPAAVETGAGRPTAFGQALQVLPGREGQVGLRLEF